MASLSRLLCSVFALSPVVLGVFGVTNCSSEPQRVPLEIGEAAAQICGGSASRDGKSESGSSGAGVGSAGTGVGVSGAGGGFGGVGGWNSAGGAGGTSTVSSSSGSGGTGGCMGQGGAGGTGGGDCGTGGAASSTGSTGSGTGGTGGGAGAAPASPELQPMATGQCPGIDINKPLKLYLSADDSNSMASPVIVRSLIRNGAAQVDPWVVRTYEFLNYYRFSFAPAPPGELSILSQLGSCSLTGDLALQIAVQSEKVEGPRRPMTVTLVLDTSGSMGGQPIELERAAVRAIAAALQPGDVVNAVTWSTMQTPVLEGYMVSGPGDPTLVSLADSLMANGGTDLHGGLTAGYALANMHKTVGGINRVILISDGQANAGITDEDLIGQYAKDEDGEGIYLVGVGVGTGVNDTLMDTVTDAGRGAYIYLDSAEEANKMFVDRFNESILVAARGVQVELTLPGYFAIQKFYGEEYSPDPTKVRPQHLAPDDSMMLFQILHPCDLSLPSADDPYRVRVTWQDIITGQSKEALQETTLGQLGIDDGNLRKAAAIVAFAEALKQLPGLDPKPREALLQDTLKLVNDTAAGGSDPDLGEIAALIETLIANQ